MAKVLCKLSCHVSPRLLVTTGHDVYMHLLLPPVGSPRDLSTWRTVHPRSPHGGVLVDGAAVALSPRGIGEK